MGDGVFAPLFCFLRLTPVLLGTLDLLGEESFFLFRAIELTPKIIDSRLQINTRRFSDTFL